MRKALVVGIDYYENINPLHGCVNDAYAIKAVLDRHSDGTKNFDAAIEIATGPTATIERKELKNKVEELLKTKVILHCFIFLDTAMLKVLAVI